MIEVNLLPGAKKGSSGGFSFSLPSIGNLLRGGGGGLPDPYILFCVGAAIVGLGYVGVSYWGVISEAEDLDVRLEEQRQESIEFATIIQQTDELRARGDSIARRVQIIQEIDANRYDWPHILDEVARAVPDFTWLREIIYQSDAPLTVRIAGRAGSLFAVTNFMGRLDASPFLRGVLLENTQQQPSEESPDDLVYLFELTVVYEPPPIDQLQTVPLFGETSAQVENNPANPGN